MLLFRSDRACPFARNRIKELKEELSHLQRHDDINKEKSFFYNVRKFLFKKINCNF